MIGFSYYLEMQSFSLFFLICPLLFWGSASGVAVISKSISVDLNGGGDFRSITAAVNSIPENNTQWIRVYVKQGVYREKVEIPRTKPKILLEGDGLGKTIIEWGDHASVDDWRQPIAVQASGGTLGSATFMAMAENFVARGITFKNTFAPADRTQPGSQAVAVAVGADKAAFYGCSFHGFQDTLCDFSGRHYFQDCYIEGAVDFIFGFGQSIYEGCELNVLKFEHPWGYLTAQGRGAPDDPSGFVFKYCVISGNGNTYLGRAWAEYSRVIFYKTSMPKSVVPEGWSAWNTKANGNLTTYVESECKGDGSDTAGRVKWMKKLTPKELAFFINDDNFIDLEGWRSQQP